MKQPIKKIKKKNNDDIDEKDMQAVTKDDIDSWFVSFNKNEDGEKEESKNDNS